MSYANNIDNIKVYNIRSLYLLLDISYAPRSGYKSDHCAMHGNA